MTKILVSHSERTYKCDKLLPKKPYIIFKNGVRDLKFHHVKFLSQKRNVHLEMSYKL